MQYPIPAERDDSDPRMRIDDKGFYLMGKLEIYLVYVLLWRLARGGRLGNR